MMLQIRRVLSLCLAGTVITLAQNSANMPWWTSDIVHDLSLSPAQTQRIHQIIRSHRDRLFDARNNVQKAEAALEDLMNEPTVNPAAAKPIIDRLAQGRAESTRVFTEMSVELRSVLTIDQWRELRKRWAEVQRTKKGRDTQVSP